MTIYRNARFLERHYECTQIVYAETSLETPIFIEEGSWEKTDLAEIPKKLFRLYTMAKVTYWGYM